MGQDFELYFGLNWFILDILLDTFFYNTYIQVGFLLWESILHVGIFPQKFLSVARKPPLCIFQAKGYLYKGMLFLSWCTFLTLLIKDWKLPSKSLHSICWIQKQFWHIYLYHAIWHRVTPSYETRTIYSSPKFHLVGVDYSTRWLCSRNCLLIF